MATTPSSFQLVKEVEAATVGDQAPTPAAGSLEIFANQNNTFYSKTSAGVVAPLVNGVTSFGDSALSGAVASTAATAQLNTATAALKGLQSAQDKIAQNSMDGRNSSLASPRAFRPGDYMVGNTYDPTGSSNSTSSFAAMKAAVVAFNDRCIIQLPPGVFKLDITVFTGFGSGSCEILGPGRGTCVLIPTTTGDFITLPNALTGSDSFTVKGFTIYNTSGTPFTTGAGINVNGCDNVLIQEIGFIDLFYDISINNAAIKVSVQETVHYQTNGNANSIGILVDNGAAGDTYLGPDIVMSNGGATRRKASINIHESGHYEITQNNLTGSAQGILIDPAAGKIVGFGFHTNVLCDSCSTNGMTLSAATATSTIKNIKSVNSWYSGTITGGFAGVLTSGTAGGIINGVTFSNDRFLNNQTHGFQHGFGTDFRFVDCDMKGNNAVGAGAGSTNAGLNVAAAVSNWSINGGKFGGTDTVPTAGNQDWGIVIAAGAGDNIKISPDDLSGNRTGPLQNGATGLNVFVNGCPGLCPGYTRGADSAGLTTTQITLGNALIPKNSVRVGTTFRVTAWFQQSSTGIATFQIRCGATNDAVAAAATNAVVVTAVTGAASAGVCGNVILYMTIQAIGASGKIQGQGAGIQGSAAYSSPASAHASGTGFLVTDLTADRYLTLSVASTVGTITVFSTTIEVVNY